MSTEPLAYQSYLLRLWRAPAVPANHGAPRWRTRYTASAGASPIWRPWSRTCTTRSKESPCQRRNLAGARVTREENKSCNPESTYG